MTIESRRPNLTAKQEKFCQNIALHHMTQHDAYINSYDAQNMLPATIDENASRMANSSKIKARLLELYNMTATPAVLSAQEKRQILADIARANLTDFIDENGQVRLNSKSSRALKEYYIKTRVDKFGNPIKTSSVKIIDAIQAIAEDNKMAGHYAPSKHLIGNVDLTPELIDKTRNETL
jgi:hypothetical protein